MTRCLSLAVRLATIYLLLVNSAVNLQENNCDMIIDAFSNWSLLL